MVSMLRAVATATLLLALGGAPSAAAATDPLRQQQYGLDIVQSDEAHLVSTGVGATVAVIDTGVRADHPDLQGRVLPGHDFVDGDGTPQDGDGHGTHVLGIVGATAGNGIGVSSVAPGATLLPVRVLGDDGSGNTDNIVKGIDYAIAQRADVINLSLGETIPLSGLGVASDIGDAVDRALDRGIVVVAAAGNTGVPFCEQPSGRDRLLCVGSVDRRRQRSSFSSFGVGLGLVAPGGSASPTRGEDILSTYNTGGYTELAGTSQATPHVAGVAALLVSLGMRGQDAVRRILATAADAGVPGPDAEFGAGIVNARMAVEGLVPAPGSPAAAGAAKPAGTAAPKVVTAAVVQRRRAVRRTGVRVRCRARRSGRCSVLVTRRGRRLAAGARQVSAGRTAVIDARLTAAGRRLVALGLPVRVRVTVRVPGVGVRRLLVTLRR
jgi:subtilisin family serine protease